MPMCWAGHPGTTEQPTCCIRCSSIKCFAGLLLPRRFKKAAMLEHESFDFYTYFSQSHLLPDQMVFKSCECERWSYMRLGFVFFFKKGWLITICKKIGFSLIDWKIPLNFEFHDFFHSA